MAFKEMDENQNLEGGLDIGGVVWLDLGEAESRSSLTVLDLRMMQETSEKLMPPPLLFVAIDDKVLFFSGNQISRVLSTLSQNETENIPAIGTVDFGLSKNTLNLKPLSVRFPINGIFIDPQETASYLEKNDIKIKHAFGLETD